jgi:hypothetical protein
MTAKGAKENGLQLYAGKGTAHGLPTASAEGVVTMIYHQVRISRYGMRNTYTDILLHR